MSIYSRRYRIGCVCCIWDNFKMAGYSSAGAGAASFIEAKIKQRKVMLFAKKRCKDSTDVRKVLDSYNLAQNVFEVCEFESRQDCNQMEDYFFAVCQTNSRVVRFTRRHVCLVHVHVYNRSLMILILVARCRTCSSVDATWVRGRKFWRSTNRENCGENSLWRAQSDGCVFMLFKLVSFPVALLFVSVNRISIHM